MGAVARLGVRKDGLKRLEVGVDVSEDRESHLKG